MPMTKAEALSILAGEAPCTHNSWEGGGTTDWAKCSDCGETFRKDNLHKRQVRAARFREALDLLTAEPEPKPVPTFPHLYITIPKIQLEETATNYQLRVLQTFFPEAQTSKLTGRATVDTGQGWLSLRYLDADVFYFEATFVSKDANAGEGSTLGRTARYTDPRRALVEVLRWVQDDGRGQAKNLETSLQKANELVKTIGELRARLGERT